MSAIDDILGQISLPQLASKLGTDEQTAESATRNALPALLGGLQANAQDPDGEASLQEALGQHDSSLVDGGVDLDQVDHGQGQQILGNIFGGNAGAVTNQLGGMGGGGQSDLMQKLLPMLAPIVMSYLAKQMGGGAGAGGMGGMLGSVLGGMGGKIGRAHV